MTTNRLPPDTSMDFDIEDLRYRFRPKETYLKSIFFEEEKEGTFYPHKLFVGWHKFHHQQVWDDISKSHVTLFAGPRGTGKTLLMRGRGDRLYLSGHNVCYLTDIKNEFRTSTEPVQDKFRKMMRNDEFPTGVPVRQFIPNFIKENSEIKSRNIIGDAIPFQFDFQDMDESDFLTLFQSETSDVVKEVLRGVYVGIRSGKISSYSELREALKPKIGKRSVYQIIDNLEDFGVLGSADRVDIVEEMRRENIIPTINLMGHDDFDESTGYPQVYVAMILRALRRAKRHNMMKGKLTVCIDEASRFIPSDSNPTSKNEIINCIKEDRQVGISLDIAVQNPEMLDDEIFRQSRYVYVPWKIDRDSFMEILKKCGLYDGSYDSRMEWSRKYRMLTEFSWLRIDRDTKKSMPIVPALSLSRHLEEF